MRIELASCSARIHPCEYNDRAAQSLIAIRSCYSHLAPMDILEDEGAKYFDVSASDGYGGSDADRLIRFITKSGHTSTLEHISYTFEIAGVSRSLLAQLSRHRVGVSLSVQSQRYVKFGSNDKARGFSFVTPPSVSKVDEATDVFNITMDALQAAYDTLRRLGVPPEDARYVFPNAACCNMTMTMNLTALLSFCMKRRHGKGAQWEIADFAEALMSLTIENDPWTVKLFEGW